MFMSSIWVFEKHLINLAKQQASRKGVKEEVSTQFPILQIELENGTCYYSVLFLVDRRCIHILQLHSKGTKRTLSFLRLWQQHDIEKRIKRCGCDLYRYSFSCISLILILKLLRFFGRMRRWVRSSRSCGRKKKKKGGWWRRRSIFLEKRGHAIAYYSVGVHFTSLYFNIKILVISLWCLYKYD